MVRDAAALIEDYFEVNDMNDIITGSLARVDLVPAFCVEGPSVMEFALSGSFDAVRNGVVVSLVINDLTVAQAEFDDSQTPSDLTLFYRGNIAAESQVKVEIFNKISLTAIAMQHL